MHNRVGAGVESCDMSVARRARARAARAPRSSPSASTRSRRSSSSETAVDAASRARPALAQEEATPVKETGPKIDWPPSRRCVALVGGVCIVLLVGLLRAPVRAPRGRAAARARDARARRRASSIGTWGDNVASSRARCAMDDLTLFLSLRLHAAAAARVLLSWRAGRAARGRPRRVQRAAAERRARHGRARGRDEPRDGLHRLRAALDPALRAVRDRDAARARRSSRGSSTW